MHRYPRTTGGKSMMWNFFYSGHGKGEHDGQGAVLKCRFRQHQMSRPEGRFDRAADVVGFCKLNMEKGLKENIHRVFWEVKEEDVERPSRLQPQTLARCKKLHYFWGQSRMDPTLLFTKEYSCMCKGCIMGHEEDCEWQEWIIEWHRCNLNIVNVEDLVEPVPDKLWDGLDHEFLSDSIVMGDVFAIKANDPVVEYYLLRCIGVKQKLTQKEVRCPWNQEHVFICDEVVVFGTYFSLSSMTKEKIVFVDIENRADVVIYSHLVRAAKIDLHQMRPTGKKRRSTPRFNVDVETHKSILVAVNEDDVLEHTRRSGPF
ncbi:hypothetical protein R1flu_023201 [Riccia fluitans]|uniref:Uncharacterized protein n=1 Tax=Riccia fluitans TaxID=41844 RepID=A0ABD1XRD4_9MARC